MSSVLPSYSFSSIVTVLKDSKMQRIVAFVLLICILYIVDIPPVSFICLCDNLSTIFPYTVIPSYFPSITTKILAGYLLCFTTWLQFLEVLKNP